MPLSWCPSLSLSCGCFFFNYFNRSLKPLLYPTIPTFPFLLLPLQLLLFPHLRQSLHHFTNPRPPHFQSPPPPLPALTQIPKSQTETRPISKTHIFFLPKSPPNSLSFQRHRPWRIEKRNGWFQTPGFRSRLPFWRTGLQSLPLGAQRNCLRDLRRRL